MTDGIARRELSTWPGHHARARATGVRSLLAGAQEIAAGLAGTALVIACSRSSDRPRLMTPNPRGLGGTGSSETWVLANISCDPSGGHSMSVGAEKPGFGASRDTRAFMPEALVPAARALGRAGKSIGEMTAVKSHNPFAPDDLHFTSEMGLDAMVLNNYGCSRVPRYPLVPETACFFASYCYAMAYPVQRCLRDLRFTSIGGAKSEILKLIIAKMGVTA